MRHLLFALLLLSSPLITQAQELKNPEKIVQLQLEAYNARDLDKFVACYHEDIKIYRYQEDTPFIVGLDGMRKVYKEVFDESPRLHALITNRMVLDNKVIDYEQVTGRKGVNLLQAIAIYEVKDGLISEVRFILE